MIPKVTFALNLFKDDGNYGMKNVIESTRAYPRLLNVRSAVSSYPRLLRQTHVWHFLVPVPSHCCPLVIETSPSLIV